MIYYTVREAGVPVANWDGSGYVSPFKMPRDDTISYICPLSRKAFSAMLWKTRSIHRTVDHPFSYL